MAERNQAIAEGQVSGASLEPPFPEAEMCGRWRVVGAQIGVPELLCLALIRAGTDYLIGKLAIKEIYGQFLRLKQT